MLKKSEKKTGKVRTSIEMKSVYFIQAAKQIFR